MTALEMRRGGGAKTARSETVTVRLDPKQRYLAEVAARIQRRTLSSYIEWAIEESLRYVEMRKDHEGTHLSVAQVEAESSLWDPIESHRFAIFALRFPELLAYEEKVLWNLILEVWQIISPNRGFVHDVKDLRLLRMNWDLFKSMAKSKMPASEVEKKLVFIEKFDLDLESLGFKFRITHDHEELKRMNERMDALIAASGVQAAAAAGSVTVSAEPGSKPAAKGKHKTN